MSVNGRSSMKTLLGILCIIGGLGAVLFSIFANDRTITLLGINGDHASTLAVWMGVFTWITISIMGIVFLQK